MGYYSDIRNSQYAAKDTALINRMNGVSNHSAIGAMLATQAPNAIMNILSGNSIFGNLTLKKNSASEEEAIQDIQKEQETNQQISDIKDFNKARSAFCANKTKANAKALLDVVNKNSNNPTIKAGFTESLRKEVEALLKQ